MATHRTRAVSEIGAIALWDAASARAELSGARAAEVSDALKQAAQAGDAFYIDVEPPASARLLLCIDSEPDEVLRRLLPEESGSYRLRLVSGRLAAGGIEQWCGRPAAGGDGELEVDARPGDYAISVRQLQHYDIQAMTDELRQRIGDDDWRHHQRMNVAGAVGCLPVLACLLLALYQAWPLLLLYALPLTAAYWLIYTLLTRTARHRRVAAEVKRYEEGLPHYLIELRPTADAASLRGGGLQID